MDHFVDTQKTCFKTYIYIFPQIKWFCDDWAGKEANLSSD